jgi:molecular chaperone GrpE
MVNTNATDNESNLDMEQQMAEREQEYGVTAAEFPAVALDENTPNGNRLLDEAPTAEAYAELKAERDQLMDRLARLQAEFDNARKRQEREKQEFRDYATGNVIEQFLPVVDNFALAMNANASADQLRVGVELIVKQMDEVLRSLNVQAIPTVGQPFDPRFHEALGTVERDDVPDHSIVDEIRKGYKIRERMLRPAMVRVANNPKQTEA